MHRSLSGPGLRGGGTVVFLTVELFLTFEFAVATSRRMLDFREHNHEVCAVVRRSGP